MIKKEKSQSTQTVPTLQQEQYKYLNFFSENLLKVDTQNFLGGTVGGTVHTLCFFLELRISQGNSQRNSSGAFTFLYTQSFLGRNSKKTTLQEMMVSARLPYGKVLETGKVGSDTFWENSLHWHPSFKWIYQPSKQAKRIKKKYVADFAPLKQGFPKKIVT